MITKLRASNSGSIASPSAMRVVVSVMRLTMRLWFNDIARSTGSKVQAMSLVGGLVGVVLAFAVWTSIQSGRQLALADLNGVEVTYGGLLFTVPALTTVFSFLYVPSRSVVTEMLSVLPIDAGVVQMAIRMMTGSVGFLIGVIFTSPLWAPVVVANRLSGAPLAAAMVAVSVCGVVTAVASTTFLTAVFRVVARVGSMAAMGCSALVTTVVFSLVLAEAVPANGNAPSGPHVHITGGLIKWAQGSVGVTSAVPFVGFLMCAILALWAADRLRRRDPVVAENSQLPLLRNVSAEPGLVWLELLQILRYPPNALSLFFVNGVAGILALASLASEQDQLGLGLITLTIISAWGVGVYGPTRRHHWVYRTTSHPRSWIGAKFLAAVLVWLLMVSFHGSWLVAITEWTLSDVLLTVPTLFVELIVACIVGMMIPVSSDTSISGSLSESFALLLLVGVGAAVQVMVSTISEFRVLATAHGLLVAVALAAYFISASRAESLEVGR
ncbi:MAG: hypothetical protein ACRCYX_06870 [Dermatophilaceae bacterium]